jgi:hypothetical protein
MKKSKKKQKVDAGEPAIEPRVDVAVSNDEGAVQADGNRRAQKRLERRRVLNEDLHLEIRTLRETVNEMLKRYQLKLDAELVQLAEATSGNGNRVETGRRLSIATAEAMLKQIRELDVKPAKGRAKDFQRVQDLVGDLIEQLPTAR